MNKKILFNVLAIIFLLLYIVLIVPIAFQNDTLFDIKLGEKYITEGINTNDTFSIHENLKYTSHHFIVNIITYMIYNNFGFKGLYILAILLTCILSFTLYKANKIFVKNKKLQYMFVFIELFLLKPFISIRAQMYSYILFLLEIILIEKFLQTSNKKWLIPLSILPLLIINFHGGTIFFYFIILCVYLLNYIKLETTRISSCGCIRKNLKYLIIPIIIGIFLMFINPFFIDGILYGLKTIGNSFINQFISEFQPLTLTSYSGEYFYIILLIIALCLLHTKSKIRLDYLLLLLGTSFMSLLAIRYFALFIICSIPCLSYVEDILIILKEKSYNGLIAKGKKVLKYTTLFLFFVIMYIFAFYKFMCAPKTFLPDYNYPTAAVEYIKENIGNDKRIFNQYEWGSLLMLNDIKVFIDSRCDLYTAEYNPDVTIAMDYNKIIDCSGNYNELLNKYYIEYLFINKHTNLANNILESNKYSKLYEDDVCLLIKVLD